MKKINFEEAMMFTVATAGLLFLTFVVVAMLTLEPLVGLIYVCILAVLGPVPYAVMKVWNYFVERKEK